ncbi:MAG: MFS transporter [Gammaproteobacteria bacterium]|nr:MFS transporter [Gammaproteobacteria bacterium]
MTLHGHPQGVPYWRLSGFYFLFFVTVGVFLPYWPLYLQSIGLDAKAIGILSAIVVITKIFVTYFWGWVVDHTGRRMQIIQLASLLSAITFSGTLFIQDFWGLLIILLLFSIFWSASLPQIEAATLTHLGESTHAYTIIRVWGSIGFIFAVWFVGIAFEYIDIGNVPIVLLGSMAIVWIMSLAIPELSVEHHAHDTNSLKEILFKPDVLALLMVCFLMLASHGPYYTFYSIYLEDNGYSSTFIGGMWALGVIAEVFLFIFMRRLIQVCGLRLLLLFSLLLAMLRWLLIGFFVENLLLLIIAQLFHAATFGVYHAVAIQYIHKYFRGRLQGRGQALYSSASFGAGMAAGSLVTGYAWDRAGALICFEGAAATALVSFFIAWFWIKD